MHADPGPWPPIPTSSAPWEERQRQQRQHELWLPSASSAWQRAGLREGWGVLDLGAGAGDCSFEPTRAMGPCGRVLALEYSPAYEEEA